MTCWLCLGADEPMIRPCTSCTATIHETCLAKYQDQPWIRYNHCGVCRSSLEPARCVPPFRVFDFDFDSFEASKLGGSWYEIVGAIGAHKTTFRGVPRIVLVRVALKTQPVSFFNVPWTDLVFTDDEITRALEPLCLTFSNRVLLVFNASVDSIAQTRSILQSRIEQIQQTERLERGKELKRVSAERRAALHSKRSCDRLTGREGSSSSRRFSSNCS